MTETQMQFSSTPWWMSDTYDGEDEVPNEFNELEGPHGLALVRAFGDGRTDRGWGMNPPAGERDGFMERYKRGEFNERRVLYGYRRNKWAFAFVMRSVRMLCVDIDGKNGGLEHASKLGALPPTLAETSKSGDGYHLFYDTGEEWDPHVGFAILGDRIGIEQGVDIRVTGCVYHYPQQRWNHRSVVKAPAYLLDQLKAREDKLAATTSRIAAVLEGEDQMEVLLMHDEILTKLRRPIPAGKRNNTLFAIGSEMQQAKIPNWEDMLVERAQQLGLDDAEITKLVNNIQRYALTAQP